MSTSLSSAGSAGGAAHQSVRAPEGRRRRETAPRAPLRLGTPRHLVMGAFTLPLQTGLLATSGVGGAKLEFRRPPTGGGASTHEKWRAASPGQQILFFFELCFVSVMIRFKRTVTMTYSETSCVTMTCRDYATPVMNTEQ